MRKLIELHFAGGEKIAVDYPLDRLAFLMSQTEVQQVPGAVPDTVVLVNPRLITYARLVEE